MFYVLFLILNGLSIYMFKQVLLDFANVPRPILHLIGAVFFIQLIDASLFILFNFYLEKLGFIDSQMAELMAYKYAAIVLFAFPLGLYIKGKKLLYFFRVASISTPSLMLLMLTSLHYGYYDIAEVLMFVFGLSSIFIKVTALPFIILNTPKPKHSEALTLYFQIFSATAFFAGISNYVLNSISASFFTEETVLWIFACLGYCSVYFTFKINLVENISNPIPLKAIFRSYDWRKIGYATFPTLLIAIGAGLTIPFINLFFLNVHGIDSKSFSLFGAMSFVLVVLVMFFVPKIRRKYGYNVVINGFQVLAVVALFVMASTEWYQHYKWASMIAIVAFLVRQPLMQVASPAISEMTLYYVGKKNQEMIAALNASIWSGSWFFSSLIFAFLRKQQIAYVNIFMLTVILYFVATIVYYRLIKAFKQNEAQAEPEILPHSSF